MLTNKTIFNYVLLKKKQTRIKTLLLDKKDDNNYIIIKYRKNIKIYSIYIINIVFFIS